MTRAVIVLLALLPALAEAQQAGQGSMDEVIRRESRGNPMKSEWEKAQEEKEFREAQVKPPAYPKARGEGLIPFFVSGASSFRFFIDPASLSVGADRVVRYTLVAISPSGYENVSYEGIRCTSGSSSSKVFAVGSDGHWKPASDSEWREITPRAVQRWHNELRGRYFCPAYVTIFSAEEGLDALRRGGHPSVANNSAGGAR